MAEKVEKVEKEKITMGFAVTSAPLWLCKELSREAKLYYADVYWPVIVEWYRKAKEFDSMVRQGGPDPCDNTVEQSFEEPKIENKDKGVSLMGGHFGNK